MDPFSHLSYDEMVNVCERLDDRDLAQLVRTSKNARDTCQWILDRKREILKQQLLEDLLGTWMSCGSDGMVKKIRFEDRNEFEIFVNQSKHLEPLKALRWDNRSLRFHRFSYMLKDVLSIIRNVLEELHEKGYKKIDQEKDIFATGDPYWKILIYNFEKPPGEFRSLNRFRPDRLLRLLEYLDMEIIPNEQSQRTVIRIAQELNKRGKFIECPTN